MRKLTFVFAFALGYLLGSRAGPEPYDQFEAKVREFLGRPEVQEKIDHAKDATVQAVSDKVPFVGHDSPPNTP